MRLLEEMVERGQVEMFGAGDTEPVLASIPARDRRGQLEKLSRKLEWRFGQRPHGAWLTERVWETTVVPALAQSGIEYVTVDDYHFLCTGKTAGRARRLLHHRGGRRAARPLPDLRAASLPLSVLARGGGRRVPRAARGPGAHLGDLLRRHREVRHLARDVRVGVREGWLKQFIEGVLASRR
jgi:4-alpha-glucanotransferase/alpha-amylase